MPPISDKGMIHMQQHTIQGGRITLTFHGIKEGQQAPPNQVVHSMRGQTHSNINNNNRPLWHHNPLQHMQIH